MQPTRVPYEILSKILEYAAELNKQDGVQFTYGISQAPQSLQKAVVQRYVRGPLRPDQLNWDATSSIRQVCSLWHEWALQYALRDVFIKKWSGGERWGELPYGARQYKIYEMIDKHRGTYVSQKPFESLTLTRQLFCQTPNVASNVRRLWFHGFFHAHTSRVIFDLLHSCNHVETVTLPWITLRHIAAHEWAELLGSRKGTPLRALELLAEDMTAFQANEPENGLDLKALMSPAVSFSNLRKLKIFGDTSVMPITDTDLIAIARTAKQLEELYLTCLSTVTIDGVMALVKSSRSTLRVLEHSPRSNDGFWHPHPGLLSNNEHICEILTSCPRLKTVSLSIPTMCAALFSNHDVRWEGDFQVRSTRICGFNDCRSHAAQDAFKSILKEARHLAQLKKASRAPRDLYVELFFADFIFEPHLKLAHGDFQLAEISSNGLWPNEKESSTKGPYGSTGLYEKEEEVFEKIDEAHFLEGLKRRWVAI